MQYNYNLIVTGDSLDVGLRARANRLASEGIKLQKGSKSTNEPPRLTN